ncbi:MAG: hypothetical protein CMO55_21815 [Verrucomicrobiales bacterium]|nr:hypothetical protein [Verrucomicrobiales bacterium]
MATTTLTDRYQRVVELRRNRTKSVFLRFSGFVVLGAIVWAWTSGGPLLGRLSAERRWTNFKNFVGELVPAPVDKSGNWGDAIPWAWELFTDKGLEALLITFGIASAAIILSALFVSPWLPLSSRKLANSNPMGIWGGRRNQFSQTVWRVVGPVVRFSFVLARSVPEYLIAFLLLSLLGLQVWPLVLALAIHNFGILGRLWGEVVENADVEATEQSIAAGGGRFSAYLSRIFPANFNRFLIYFFYRWETCMKDATVLGMLGLLTLGKLIMLEKGFHWDRVFFYILLGASVILIGDLFSTFLRRRLR